MAFVKGSNAELGIYSVEGWSRASAGNEVVRDSSVFHAGAWSWLAAGDGVSKSSWLPITSLGSNRWYVIRKWLRLNNLPTGQENVSPSTWANNGAQRIAALMLNANGTLNINTGIGNIITTGGVSAALTVGQWYKVEGAFIQHGTTQAWLQAIWRLNDVEFARYFGRPNFGSLARIQTIALNTSVARQNVDDIVINDDSGSTANYWNDADRPRSAGKTAPTVRSTSTPVIGSTQVPSIVVNKPSSVVEGDLLVATLIYSAGGAVFVNSFPTGWTSVTASTSVTGFNVAVLIKRATASEPSTYTFGTNTNTRSISVCHSLRSVASVPIIDAQSVGGSAPSSTAQMGISCLDLTEGDALILQAVAHSAAPTITPPAWWSSVSGAKDSTNLQELQAGVYTSTDGGLSATDLVATSAAITAASTAAVAFRGIAPSRNKFRAVV